MLNRVLFRAAAVAVALALGGSAKADFVVDDFSAPNPSTGFVSLPGAIGSVVRGPEGTGSAGVSRTLTVNQTVNSLGASGATQYLIGTTPVGGRLAIATAPSATANASLLYSYATAQNLAAGGTSLQFTFATADFAVPYSVRITDSTGATSTQSGSTATGAGVYSFSTGSFTGVNLGSVTSVLLSLNRNLQTGGGDVVSADFSLSDVRVLTPTVNPPAVPAPPAAVLVLAALPLLGLARARRNLPV